MSAKSHSLLVSGVRPATLTAKLLIILAMCALMSVPHIFACWIVGMVVMPKEYARRYALFNSSEYVDHSMDPQVPPVPIEQERPRLPP